MSEWDEIQGFEGWRKKLGELLSEAEAAARGQDVEARLKLSWRLNEFVDHSRPNDDQIRALDGIAGQAATDLMRVTIEERLTAIIERSTDLAKLTKEFQAQAEAAVASARSIRLDRAHRLVRSLTDSVNSIKELRGALKGGTDDELAAHLDRVLKSLQELRSLVERES